LKRYGNLYSKIVDRENIELAYNKARKGKNWQKKIKRISQDKDYYLDKLQDSLINKTFHTAEYKTKWIYEPKARLIYILPFYPDRIVQHAIMNVVAPIWDSLMIDDSYSCRTGKGQHAASKRCMQFVKRNKFCLQCDVSKFYPSIDHEIVFDIIQEKIKDKDLLWLLHDIINSAEGGKNAPIGNYTSQWFGNLYMNKVDMRVKHIYKVKDYIRYCDDFLFFSNNKEDLKRIGADISEYMGRDLKLKLSKCNLFNTSQGVDFLGYRHFPDGKILVRKRTAKRIRRNMKQIPYLYEKGFITAGQALSKVASANGWLKYANSYNFRKSIRFDDLNTEVRGYK
jgi:hypothetical protein